MKPDRISYDVIANGRPIGMLVWLDHRLTWTNYSGDRHLFDRGVSVRRVRDRIAFILKLKKSAVVVQRRAVNIGQLGERGL